MPPRSVATFLKFAAYTGGQKQHRRELEYLFGLKGNGPKAIQRDAPFSERPICGTNVSSERTIAKPKKYGVYGFKLAVIETRKNDERDAAAHEAQAGAGDTATEVKDAPSLRQEPKRRGGKYKKPEDDQRAQRPARNGASTDFQCFITAR